MTPTGLEEDLCRCSDLALKNNLNFFKIDEKGVCRIGTANAEECGTKRLKIGKKICSRKSAAIYKTSKI
ncbi:hypothetical protein MXB_555 [Myxobolus squamalis]|nr:hypothetical protein MXB_555 [Myxobolus squamalis]